jgi:NAD-dependent DNA ligase
VKGENHMAMENMEMEEIQSEISALKQLLANSDYQALKHADGELSDDEYAEMKEKRQQWRDRINELQAQQQSLEDGKEITE